MICGLPVANAKHVCETEAGAWMFSIYRVPENDPRGVNRFFGLRQLALVTIADLRRSGAWTSNKIIARHFKLTPAEERLCEMLVNDLTLNECADRLGVSIETVRSQAKTILQKTGTSRQSELIALLLRSH